RWSLMRSSFDEVLRPSKDVLRLWGDWTIVVGEKAEHVSVRSALVSLGHSDALLRALQAAPSNLYHIGTAQDDGWEIDRDRFQLKGWVDDSSGESGLDEHDSWAGRVRFPRPRPTR